MNYVVLDFETSDPWIEQGRGSGWPEGQAKFLCAALGGPHRIEVYTESERLVEKLNYEAPPPYDQEKLTIVAHNALYEAGILHSLGFDIESVTWIDTKILAVLIDNNSFDFSLAGLAKKYLNEEKNDGLLGTCAIELGLVKTKISNPVTVAKKNMAAIYERYPETVGRYVRQDVALTDKLFIEFMRQLQPSNTLIQFHSDLIKALTLSRAKGVRVDVMRARRLGYRLQSMYDKAVRRVGELAPGVNMNSTQQLAQYFISQGFACEERTDKMEDGNTLHNTLRRIKPADRIPVTEKGNPSITSEWLAEVDHPLGGLINEAKKIQKLIRDFVRPVLELAKPGETHLKVYPEIKIYGAAATGRATCSSPNLQQVPKRTDLGKLVRTMYVPEEGEVWHSFDFSAQESRLQVHYAHQIGARGALRLVEKFQQNPLHDLHQQVAEMVGIDRTQAKTINLGLSYGMGDNKLAKSLKVSKAEAVEIRGRFNRLAPFLSQINTYSMQVMKQRGHILTLNGRKLYNEAGFSRKALNKLIQGGAADQMWKALVDCYRAGKIPMFPVHDSLEFSLKDPKDQAIIKKMMEEGTKLHVPNVVDVESGPTWGELE